MSRELLLALDLGTTGVRALLMTPAARVLSRAYLPLETVFPAPGRVEQDPQEMWEKSLQVLRSALESAAVSASEVAGLGVVSQRSTVIAWETDSGRPVAPAISWQDQRTAPEVADWNRKGIPINTLASATKLRWWLEHEPAVQRAAREGRLCYGTPDSWLGFRLSGGAAYVTDPSHASCTGLFDAESETWSDGLLGLFGVDGRFLPALVPTSAVVGETLPDLLGAPVPLAARAGDQQAATFAQGAHRVGEAKLTLGTAAMLDLNTGEAPDPAGPGTYSLALWKLGDAPVTFCLEGTVITAGAAVDWLVSIGLLSQASEFDRVGASVSATGGVVFVPALQGLGSPFLDDGARGLLGGLTRGSGRGEIVRAVAVGIAMRCVDVCEAVGGGEADLRVDGGLSRSDLLLGFLADLSGRRVLRSHETEGTALGGALLAGLATGIYATPADCREVVGSGTAFEPRLAPGLREAARERWGRIVERARSGAKDGPPGW